MTMPGDLADPELWGWFGPPWLSLICYDDNGRLISEMRKAFPAGEQCLYCGETFDEAAGDSGRACSLLSGGRWLIRHVHKECQLREVMGSVAHLEGRCSCNGGTGGDDPGRSRREEALAVWAWVTMPGRRRDASRP